VITRYVAEALLSSAGWVHRPGVLDVEGNRIAWAGPADIAPPMPGHRVVDIGGLVMPGLVNTHAHTPMTLLRSSGDGLPLDRWLRESMWPREARMTDEDVHWGMLFGLQELLRCGVTTTCEMYLHGQAVAEAALQSGIRCVITPAVFDVPGVLTWQRALDDVGSLYDAYDGRSDLITVGVGPHAAYTLPTDALVASARLARELDTILQIHVSETVAEDQPIRDAHGCTTPQLLARLGVLDARVLAAHSVWLTDTDLSLYEDYDIAVAHCPQSNGKLGSGVARVAVMVARDLRVGLGTDGPASNDNLDLWEEMRLAPLLARAVSSDPQALTTTDALHLATRGGAEALDLNVGTLEAGRFADFIRLDLSEFVPVADGDELRSHLVWSASSRAVTDVWVGGRRVVTDGVCTTIDAAEARRQVARRAERLQA